MTKLNAHNLSILVLLLLFLDSAAAAGPFFTATGLGNVTPKAINDLGQVVGQTGGTHPSPLSAFVWQSGTFTNLGIPLGGTRASAEDISNNGLVVGSSDTSPSGIIARAFTLDLGTNAIVDLGTFGGSTSIAYAVSESGFVGGTATDGGQRARPFLYDPVTGTKTNLQSLGAAGGRVDDLNEGNQTFNTLVGAIGAGFTGGEMWAPPGTAAPLGDVTLGGDRRGGINDRGQIATGAKVGGSFRASLFEVELLPGGPLVTRTDLGTLGGASSHARDINNQAQVVGTSGERAFLWQDGIMTNLNDLVDPTLGWTLDEAVGINEAGQMIVTAFQPGVGTTAFFLDPVSGTGFLPQTPVVPTVVGDAFVVPLTIGATGLGIDMPIYIDPEVALGYDYSLDPGDPDFASVLLPDIGDGSYELHLWDGSAFVLSDLLEAGTEHIFAGGVDRFRILGIEASAGLDPGDPLAFVTGLTFASAGAPVVTMTAIVPLPATGLLLASGAVGLLTRRRVRTPSYERTTQRMIGTEQERLTPSPTNLNEYVPSKDAGPRVKVKRAKATRSSDAAALQQR